MKKHIDKIIWSILITSFIIIFPLVIIDSVKVRKYNKCEDSGGTYIEKENGVKVCIFTIKKYT